MTSKIKIAILDDYQNIALSMADWSAVEKNAEITVFHDHISDQDKLVERLLPFNVLSVMRERTPLNKEIFDRLPNLKLVISTGLRNAAIDVDAAKAAGIELEIQDIIGLARLKSHGHYLWPSPGKSLRKIEVCVPATGRRLLAPIFSERQSG